MKTFYSRGEACLLVRCDFTIQLNTSSSPHGYSCIQYQLSIGSKIYNKAKCAYAPSSFYDPCENIVKTIMLPTHMQNCQICFNDGCNAFAKPSASMGVLLALIGLGLLACLFALCIGARNKYFCEVCKA
ncbi:hypothetical protein M8J77_000011 [Diaphorina citri]|nr:hypothetical protein M8J77_000011 [Diaphorina citri]